MRIISGTCRGRKLAGIQGRDIRPTTDRVREALFNIIGPGIRGMRVLDLFAGTGAFGLEALSRGAQAAVFVDSASTSCAVIKENITRCCMDDQAMILCHDLGTGALPGQLFTAPFDLIFMDPPYRMGLADATMALADFLPLLAPEGRVIVEQDHKESLDTSGTGLDIYRQKKYSKTFISFLHAASSIKG